MSTNNIYFEQKYDKYQNFFSEKFQFLVVEFSIYLNRHILVMQISLRISIRVFIVRMKNLCIFGYPKSAQGGSHRVIRIFVSEQV